MVGFTIKKRTRKASSSVSAGSGKESLSQVSEKAKSLKDVPMEVRKKEAEKPIYLIRYE